MSHQYLIIPWIDQVKYVTILLRLWGPPYGSNQFSIEIAQKKASICIKHVQMCLCGLFPKQDRV